MVLHSFTQVDRFGAALWIQIIPGQHAPILPNLALIAKRAGGNAHLVVLPAHFCILKETGATFELE
jgi:hypothetical protein